VSLKARLLKPGRWLAKCSSLAALCLVAQGGAGWSAERAPPRRPVESSRPSKPQPAPVPTPPVAAPEPQPAAASRGRENPGIDGACLAALQALYGSGIRKPDAKAPAPGNAACQVAEPVVVASLKLAASTIAFEPPVTLSCEMATRAAAWLNGSIRPLTRGSFDCDLVGLRVGGGHECRLRNRASTGPISEHATARALDIFAFMLSGPPEGAVVSVEKPENDTQRQYLSAVRQSGCGAFSTTLGPGADAAHANHLHLDIQSRRSPATRFCQ